MTTTTKLTKKTIDAIAHNLIVDEAIQTAWAFVTNMQVNNEFEYAFAIVQQAIIVTHCGTQHKMLNLVKAWI